jgi:hypothetical protein
MQETSRTDIRRLLKAFGIQADEEVSAHLENHPGLEKLHIRLILEDLTDYGDSPPDESLRLELRGEIRR